MDVKNTDLVNLFERVLSDLPSDKLQEIGYVIQVGDGICRVYGLENALYNELIKFDNGNEGIIFELDQDSVAIFLLYNDRVVQEGEIAKRTNTVLTVPVGPSLVGRVVNAIGNPVDGLDQIVTQHYRSVEAKIPPVIVREPINQPLETGILAVDALVPIGKGQRELIIGNRSTGKTALAIDTILHQKGRNVHCIYVAIAQRQAHVARIVRLLEQYDALSYTTVVVADAGQAVLNHYLAPYTGCAMAEYFRDNGHNALIVYDDLSNHAIAFRQMSLLLRRSPGREAYPGDVFYLHSRLLERAGKLEGGGSLTALPIVQIQNDDLTAYIPTNLISITDGQIFLDSTLFNKGVRPAVNAELSVSRVAGAAQTRAMRSVVRTLKLDLAQYKELVDFAQFGTDLDESAQQQLARGARVIELLKQEEHETFSMVEQVLMLFLLQRHYLDHLPVNQVREFATQFVAYMRSLHAQLCDVIGREQDLSEATQAQIATIAHDFTVLFAASTGSAEPN